MASNTSARACCLKNPRHKATTCDFGFCLRCPCDKAECIAKHSRPGMRGYNRTEEAPPITKRECIAREAKNLPSDVYLDHSRIKHIDMATVAVGLNIPETQRHLEVWNKKEPYDAWYIHMCDENYTKRAFPGVLTVLDALLTSLAPGAEDLIREYVVKKWSSHQDKENSASPELDDLLYNLASIAAGTIGETQRVALALLAHHVTRSQFNELLQTVGSHHTGTDSFQRANDNFDSLLSDGTILPSDRQCRVKPETVISALNYMKSSSVSGIRPGQVRNPQFNQGRVVVKNVPYYLISTNIDVLYQSYVAAIPAAGKRLGVAAFHELANAVCVQNKAQTGVSYYYASFMQAMKTVKRGVEYVVSEARKTIFSAVNQQVASPQPDQVAVTDSLAVVDIDGDNDGNDNEVDVEPDEDDAIDSNETWIVSKESMHIVEDMPKHLGDVLKHHGSLPAIRSSITSAQCDGEAGHCSSYAFDGTWCSRQEHTFNCADCQLVFNGPAVLHIALNETSNQICQTMELTNPNFSKSQIAAELSGGVKIASDFKAQGRAYYAHRIRGVYQSEQIKDLVNNLKPNQVHVAFDYKMKILQMFHMESSVNWYGKTGMSLFGAYLIWVMNGERHGVFLDLIPDGCKQDAVESQAMMYQVVKFVHDFFKGAKAEVSFQSDNAANFASRLHLEFIYLNNLDRWGLGDNGPRVTRYIYSEPQHGKNNVDAHFSFLSLGLRNYVDQEHDVTQPKHIFEGLKSANTYNTTVQLVKMTTASLQAKTTGARQFPLTGSRDCSDILFPTEADDHVVRVFAQTKVGEEKLDMKSHKLETWRQSVEKLYDFKLVRKSTLEMETYHNIRGVKCNFKVEPPKDGPIEVQIKDERASPLARLMAETLAQYFTSGCEGDVESDEEDDDDDDNASIVVEKDARTLAQFVELLPKERMSVMPERGWALRKETKVKKSKMPIWVKNELERLYIQGEVGEHRNWKPAEALQKLKEMDREGSVLLFDSIVTESSIAGFFSSFAQQRKRTAAVSASRIAPSRATTTTTASTQTATTSSSSSSANVSQYVQNEEYDMYR